MARLFFFLSKSLDLVFAPLAWVAALLTVALVLLWRRSARRRLMLGCLVAALAVVLVAGNPMVANRIWWTLERGAPRTYRADHQYDVVILLGGMLPTGVSDPTQLPSYGDGVDRMLVTFDLLRSDRARSAIISGGVAEPPPGMQVEAEVVASQLHAWGVPRERLVVDGRSVNTRQNAIETARIVRDRGDATVLLVTSAFHMERAVGCFRAVDVAVDTLPVDHRASAPDQQAWNVAPRSDAFDRTSEALREMAGRIVYRVLGYAR